MGAPEIPRTDFYDVSLKLRRSLVHDPEDVIVYEWEDSKNTLIRAYIQRRRGNGSEVLQLNFYHASYSKVVWVGVGKELKNIRFEVREDAVTIVHEGEVLAWERLQFVSNRNEVWRITEVEARPELKVFNGLGD